MSQRPQIYDPPEKDSTENFNTTKSSSSGTVETNYVEKTPLDYQEESLEEQDHVLAVVNLFLRILTNPLLLLIYPSNLIPLFFIFYFNKKFIPLS